MNFIPTRYPTFHPSFSPTFGPSFSPTFEPSSNPSHVPTLYPSLDPTTSTSSPTSPPTSSPSSSKSIVCTVLQRNPSKREMQKFWLLKRMKYLVNKCVRASPYSLITKQGVTPKFVWVLKDTLSKDLWLWKVSFSKTNISVWCRRRSHIVPSGMKSPVKLCVVSYVW